MKKIMFALMIIVLGISFTANAQTQDKSKNTKEVSGVKSGDKAPINSICPVSGEEPDKEITYEYNGKTYTLCCNSCLKKFKKDPEKYISRLSEDGKSLKKK